MAAEKVRLESELKSNHKMLKATQLSKEVWTNDLGKIKDKLEEIGNDYVSHQKTVHQMDLKILNMEDELARIKKEKVAEMLKLKKKDDLMQQMSMQKVMIEEHLIAQTPRITMIIGFLQDDIEELEEKIVENLKKTLNVYSGKEEATAPDPSKKLLNFLIAKKEADLECPVCLVTCYSVKLSYF